VKIVNPLRAAGAVSLVLGTFFGLGDLVRVIARNPAYAWDPGVIALWAVKSVFLAAVFALVFTLPATLLAGVLRPGDRSPQRARRVAAGAWIGLHVFLILLWQDYESLERELSLARMAAKLAFLAIALAAAWFLSSPAARLAGAVTGALRPGRVVGGAGVLLLALGGALWASARAPELARGAPGPNVLFIVVDTLRADALGAYGSTRPTSPAIDRLAARGVRFEDAVAESSWTIPTVASIFTGVFPAVHRVTNYEAVLAEPFLTMAEAFRAAGYRTGARISNIFVKASHGYHQGFDDARVVMNLYKLLFLEKLLAQARVTRHYDFAPGDEISDAAVSWLRRHGDEPFFLYLHYYDPHFPYYPPPDYAMRYVDPGMAGRFPYHAFVGDSLWNIVSEYKIGTRSKPDEIAYNRAVYDAEINFVDDQIGRVLSYLHAIGLEERTIVVFTADHGEQFYEHGARLHSKTLYREETHVPLIIRAPGFEPRVVKQRVRALDLYLTLPDLARILEGEATGEVAGRVKAQAMGGSLVPLMAGEGPPPASMGETFTSLDIDGVKKEAFYRGEWKLIRNIDQGDDLPRPPLELYRLSEDPEEKNDLASREATRRDQLAALQEARWKAMAARAVAEVERKPLGKGEIEKLKALGYLQQ
jgi:arylsulfatase